MIELPDGVVPNAANPRLVDFGFVQESAGGDATRIVRPGNRFEVELTFPPAYGEDARIFIARLNRAKGAGLRCRFPLQGVSQGNPGTPVVDGSDSGGTTLKLRGLNPGYVVKEGYWLTLINPAGKRYLHNSAATVIANGLGKATLTVDPPLRVFPADGWAVELYAPTIEGNVMNDAAWSLTPGHLVSGVTITLRESA